MLYLIILFTSITVLTSLPIFDKDNDLRLEKVDKNTNASIVKNVPFLIKKTENDEKKNIGVINDTDLKFLTKDKRSFSNKNIDLEVTLSLNEIFNTVSPKPKSIEDINFFNNDKSNSSFLDNKNISLSLNNSNFENISSNFFENQDKTLEINYSKEKTFPTKNYETTTSNDSIQEKTENSNLNKEKLDNNEKANLDSNSKELITENTLTDYSLTENSLDKENLISSNSLENNDISVQKSKLVTSNQSFYLNKSINYQSNSSEHLQVKENNTDEKIFKPKNMEAKSLNNFKLNNIIEDQSFLNASIDENEIPKKLTNSSSIDITSKTLNSLLNDKINQTLDNKISNNKDSDEEPSYIINQKIFSKEKLDTARKKISLDNEDYVDIQPKLIRDKKQYYNARNLIHNKQQNNFLINYLSSICVAAFGFIIGILIGLILFSSN